MADHVYWHSFGSQFNISPSRNISLAILSVPVLFLAWIYTRPIYVSFRNVRG